MNGCGDGKNLAFTYDSDGLRLTKTVDDTTTYSYFYAGGKLMRQTDGTNTLDFFYDESGHPYALTYNGTTYYYVTNLQGDVLHILNSSKQVVASYSYDPYGKVLSATGTLAEVNPLRYRGYVYDSETGFYYLQSRYYDPTICRFINADSYASTGQGIIGCNMFVYCNNNPAIMTDSSGAWPTWADIWDEIEKAIEWAENNIIQPVVVFVEDVEEDFNNYDSSNQNEDVVFSSNYFSNYKGTLVVKTPFDASFSFGFIGLSIQQQNANTLKHEYGHAIQMENMGTGSYLTDVAIPSAIINFLSRLDKLPYNYYTYPFEAEANKLGGSTLSNPNRPPLPEGESTSFWDLIVLFFQ